MGNKVTLPKKGSDPFNYSEDDAGDEFNALIFFDGRKRKVVKTDPWLKELVSE